LSAVLLAVRVGGEPAYASQILPPWLLGGVGVGLALPTILSSATKDLPLHQAATGSAIVNMSRQVGSVLGVSVLVAVLGQTGSLAAFQHGWWVIAGVAGVGALAAVGMAASGAAQPAPQVRAAALVD
ncbi:MAG: drug resistance transporter, EmrB/QacA subfamily, partial [Frankiales bacterium]|nr:drug resistance transporter, EmrB/QacA subfamily [Frankiales bacterium]